jgi:hypothetical protein
VFGLIVILVAAGDASLPGAKAMADACSAAVVEGSCVVVPSGGEPGESKAIATVSWAEGQRQTALVRVVPSGSKTERERRLVFAPTDPEIERWKAVGFAVATLVGEAPHPGETRPETTPFTPSEEGAPGTAPGGKGLNLPPVVVVPAASRSVTVALQGVMASVTRSQYMLGSSLRGGVVGEGPIEWAFELTAGLLPAGSHAGVETNLWWFGPLARWHLADRQSIHPVASFAFQIERQIFEAERGPYFGLQKSWQVAGTAGLGLEWPLWHNLAVMSEVNLGVRSGATLITVQGKDETDIPRFKAVFGLGVVGSL